MAGTLHEDQYMFFIISRSVYLRMKSVSDKSCTEYQNSCCVFSNFFFLQSFLYESMWNNMVEPGRLQMTIWHMRNACWIPKATNEHSEYVIHIVFPPQQWLHESSSVLGYSKLYFFLIEVHCLLQVTY